MIVPFDVRAIELYLKQNQKGEEALKALHLRTASHWLDPSVDRLSSRMLRAYDKLCELVEWPFNILDAGCMCGYLKHHMELKLGKKFRYAGIDIWDEALEVAKIWQPGIEVYKADILQGDLPVPYEGKWDYVWYSNIVLDHGKVIERLLPIAERALFIAQPPFAGEVPYPHDAEVFDCGETTLIRINGNHNVLGAEDSRS